AECQDRVGVGEEDRSWADACTDLLGEHRRARAGAPSGAESQHPPRDRGTRLGMPSLDDQAGLGISASPQRQRLAPDQPPAPPPPPAKRPRPRPPPPPRRGSRPPPPAPARAAARPAPTR